MERVPSHLNSLIRSGIRITLDENIDNPFLQSFDPNRPELPLSVQSVKKEWVRGALKEAEASFLEDMPVRILVGSWNVNATQMPNDLTSWLKVEGGPPDIVLIGLQEVDISAEAFVGPGIFKEEFWNQTLLHNLSIACPDVDYQKIASKLYVGIYAVAFARKSLTPYVTHVATGFAACGLMGLMGNKGAAGIRFRLFNDYVCFMSTHLAAHIPAVQRRNQDAAEIARRTYFSAFEEPKPSERVVDELAQSYNEFMGPATIWDSSILIWAGDLNYRVPMDAGRLKSALESLEAGTLTLEQEIDLKAAFRMDQLNVERTSGRAFSRFEEPQITFSPTFKFDPGTDNYDSSEKNRTPAWCDRILYRRGDRLQPISYEAIKTVRASDHKPVRCLFDGRINKINIGAFEKTYGKILKRLDQFENELIPMTQLGEHQIDVGELVFRRLVMKSIDIYNVGQVICQFRLIPKLSDNFICKPWIKPKPAHGIIMPGQSMSIQFFFFVDPQTAVDFNNDNDVVEDIVIVHVEGGKDHFVSITGSFRKTVFCRPLSEISDLAIEKVPKTGLIRSVRKIPAPIWRLVDFIYNHGLCTEGIFMASGLEKDIEILQSCLDLDKSIPPELATDSGLLSAAEILLRFLDCLPDSVIPRGICEECLRVCEDLEAAQALLEQLPAANKVLFDYLISFLQHLLDKNTSFDKNDICYVFAPILMKSSASSSQDQYELRKKTIFLCQFL